MELYQRQPNRTEEEAEEREERRLMREQLIGPEASRAMAFQTVAVRHFGADAGIFLRQLLYRDGTGRLGDFWIYKSMAEWEEETGLQRRGQERARKRLGGAGVMEEKKALVHGRRMLHFRVNPWKVMEILGDGLPHAEPLTSGTDYTPSRTVSMSAVGKDHVGSRPGITEEYSEEDSEEFSPSGPREHKSSREKTTTEEIKSPESGRMDTATTTSGEGPCVQGEKKAGKVAVDVLERALKEAGYGDGALTPKERKRFGGQVKCNQDFEDELPAIVACVVAAWPERRLDAVDAYEEVLRQGLRRGTPVDTARRDAWSRDVLDSMCDFDDEEMDAWKRGALDELGDAWARRISARLDADDVASATPRAGIEALRAYEHPSFGYNDLGAYAGLAGRWDFSGEDDPPWQITKEMGGTPDDQRTMLKRLRSVTRRAVRQEAESKEVG